MRTLGFAVVLALAACHSAAKPTPPLPPKVEAKVTVGTYFSGGTCEHGTPENPTCMQTLELSAGGKGSFIGDDIVEPATWTQAGEKLTIALANRTLELQAKADGTLVDEHGIVYTLQP